MLRAIKRLCALIVISAIAGQSATAVAQPAPPCRVDSYPIYHADGRWISGRIRSCSTGFTDITPAPNNIKPGEMLFLVGGRIALNQRNAFVRAKPNWSYPILPSEPEAFAILYQDAKRGVKWSSMARTLPFAPTEVYDQGLQEKIHKYTYGKVALLPSKAKDSFPINSNSVIFSVDGFGFMSPDAWRGLMFNPAPSRYVEVLFYQRDESPKIIRRAFVPMFERVSVNAEWQTLTRRYPLLSDQEEIPLLNAAAAGLGLALIIGAYYKSGLSWALEGNCDSYSLGSGTCWHDPLNDAFRK